MAGEFNFLIILIFLIQTFEFIDGIIIMFTYFALYQKEELIHEVITVSINFESRVQNLTFKLEIAELKIFENNVIFRFFIVVLSVRNELGSNYLVSIVSHIIFVIQRHKIEWVIKIIIDGLSLYQDFDSNVFKVKFWCPVPTRLLLFFLPCKLEFFNLITQQGIRTFLDQLTKLEVLSVHALIIDI